MTIARRRPRVYVSPMAKRPASAAASGRKAGIGSRPVARLRDRLDSKRSSRLLGALAEPERLRIIQCLEKGPCAVGEICKALRSPVANVSHHLQHLRHVGLVRVQRRGRHMLYSLTPGLFRPPEGDAPPAFDFGVCRLELGGVADKAAVPNALDDTPVKSRGGGRGKAPAQLDDLHPPKVEGTWTGQWTPSNAANASVARGEGRKEIVCVIEARGGEVWHATFEGESGHAYKYSVAMEGRLEGGAVLFKGSTDLGARNGGVFDWVGRATDDQFVGFYSSSHYTGVFNLKRVKKK